MNEQTIETLLRKAPRAKAPAGLLKDLQADIELPRATSHESPITNHALRRWLPALGFALWFLGCVIVFGIQASHITELKRTNEKLAAANAAAALPQAEQDRARLIASEVEQLRKDTADAQRLRTEVEQLRAQVAQLDVLRTQNQQLREELQVRNATAAPPKPEEDFFATVATRADRIKCVNNLKQVCLAARIWANDHKDILPRDFETMKNELVTEKITFCPRDQGARYEIISPGATELRPEVVYVRCTIHNNVGLCDGSVQQLQAGQPLEKRDGEWIIGRAGQ